MPASLIRVARPSPPSRTHCSRARAYRDRSPPPPAKDPVLKPSCPAQMMLVTLAIKRGLFTAHEVAPFLKVVYDVCGLTKNEEDILEGNVATVAATWARVAKERRGRAESATRFPFRKTSSHTHRRRCRSVPDLGRRRPRRLLPRREPGLRLSPLETGSPRLSCCVAAPARLRQM
mmetsp:Transcript_25427/g.66076  ORF Transcript_25427/g.66076 Transcript_25427/m.66076 type:complete len:175 (-) Transcript_25427:1438-1962(-)